MSQILTFLGKGGVGKTYLAIAIAKGYASQGKKVLLVGQEVDGGLLALGQKFGCEPEPWMPNLQVAQLQATTLLSSYWEKMKAAEAQFLRTPFFQEVYGQELGILPGMDQALALSWLREKDQHGGYDSIIYDGTGDLTTLRMLGMPEILGWYLRRFRQVLTSSALGQTIAPFVEPMLRSVVQVSGDISQQAGQMTDVLSLGAAAVNDPKRVIAYLVTSADPAAIATAKYLWGSAQQVGLTVGGVFSRDRLDPAEFSPLELVNIPDRCSELTLDFNLELVPSSMVIDLVLKQVKLFLPGFDKKQVKLIQSGPEVTIEAGDQRRNLFLPPALAGKPATGAKFQDGYLIISF
ncbi:MAG: ArsA family ATPase [Pseudanabaenaceae cyanobacterium bins.68]|nr:ArsA family ATPase [Pseudanabaenaceae cyanobacterium bins.68]